MFSRFASEIRIFVIAIISFVILGIGAAATAAGPVYDLSIHLQSRTIRPVAGLDLPRENNPDPYGIIQFKRPLTSAETSEVAAAGVALLHYLPHQAWLAALPADLNQVAALPYVHWIGPVQPGDKLDDFLRSGQIPPWAGSSDGFLHVTVSPFGDVPWSDFLALVEGYGTVTGTMAETSQVALTLPAGAVWTLAGEESVRWVSIASPEPEALNSGSRLATETEPVQAAPYGLKGNGVQVAMWDQGVVDVTHPDFAGRVTIPLPAETDGHATHVGGTVLGDGTNSPDQTLRGYAPGAELISYYWSSPITGHNAAINTYGADVSQNSWGLSSCAIFGRYAYMAADYDRVITGLYGRHIPVVFAAGNGRGLCGLAYGTVLGGAQSAKNVLTVGGVKSDTGALLETSSWGPVLDGRLKPELVAPGGTSSGGIISTAVGGGYTGGTGTSMAAPAVSGATALLLERFHTTCPASGDSDGNPLPSTLRALLVHTADDLDDPLAAYLQPGPDFASGYGELDSNTAVDMMAHHKEGSVDQGGIDTYPIAVPAGMPLKVTLAWDDVPGVDNAAITLVNDLDLTLIAPDGTVYGPWLLNPAPGHEAEPAVRPVNQPHLRDDRNVIEQVLVDTPQPGIWTVLVAGTNIPAGPQSYSLVSDLLNNCSCAGAPPTDLWLASGAGPENEPPVLTNEDIWVEDEPLNTGTHVNPEFGEPNYTFARIHNGGTETAYDVQVNFYWATPATALAWPADLHYIGSAMVTNLPAGAEAVVGPVTWHPPHPDDPAGSDAYLFVRLVTLQDPLQEDGDFWANWQQNNGIGGKTVRVVNENPDDPTAIHLAGVKAGIEESIPGRVSRLLVVAVFLGSLTLLFMRRARPRPTLNYRRSRYDD